MGSFDELSTMAAWEATPDGARREVVRRLAGALGEGFEPSASGVMLFGKAKLPGVVHKPTGLALIAVPGGSFEMGLTHEDAEELAMVGEAGEEGEIEDLLAEMRATSTPARRVSIRPFLIGRSPIVAGMLESFGEPAVDEDAGGVPPRFVASAVPGLLARFGFRLPSEAEWEWVAREGGRTVWVNGTSAQDVEAGHAALYAKPFRPSRSKYPAANGWGVWGLPWGDWVADAWRDSYEGLPSEGTPWFRGDVPEIVRGNSAMTYPWQNESEGLLAWAGYRWRAGATDMGCVRPALDLPG